MTLKTWKDEFYPVPADDPSIETDLQAIKHSLRKWEGLRYDNRAKHDISSREYMGRNYIHTLGGLTYLYIDSGTCALCVRHIFTSNCRKCPLYLERGMKCDSSVVTGNIHKNMVEVGRSPYQEWTINVNPEPMIELLKAALETEKRKQA